jgi:hypothetical protein
MPLSEQELVQLGTRTQNARNAGRLKASSTNTINKNKREEANFLIAKDIFNNNLQDMFFISGIILYWCEGTKKSNFFPL